MNNAIVGKSSKEKISTFLIHILKSSEAVLCDNFIGKIFKFFF